MRRSSRSTDSFRRGTIDRKEAFKKIVTHCLYYPMVPISSKIWGITIEFLLVQDLHAPFALFVLDRTFASMQGIMIALIYFTDPAVIDVGREFISYIKRCYVDNYYCVQFGPDEQAIPQDMEENKVQQTMPNTAGPSNVAEEHQWMIPAKEQNNAVYSVSLADRCLYIRDLQRHADKQHVIALCPTQRSKSSLPVSVALGRWYPLTRLFRSQNQRKPQEVPMRRIDHTSILSFDWDSQASTGSIKGQNAGVARPITSDTFKPYCFPHFARSFHWLLMHVFHISPRRTEEMFDEPSIMMMQPSVKSGAEESLRNEPAITLRRLSKTATQPDIPPDTQPEEPSLLFPELPESAASSPTPRRSISTAAGSPSVETPKKGKIGPFLLTQGIHSAPTLRRPSALRLMTGLGSLTSWRGEKTQKEMEEDNAIEEPLEALEEDKEAGVEAEAEAVVERSKPKRAIQEHTVLDIHRFPLSPPPAHRRPKEEDGASRSVLSTQMARPPTFVESDVGGLREILMIVPPLPPSPSTPPPPPPTMMSSKKKGKLPLRHQNSAPQRGSKARGSDVKGKKRASEYEDYRRKAWRISQSGSTPPLPDHRQSARGTMDSGRKIEGPAPETQEGDDKGK
ncbi:hypothetical protein DFQ28_009771 [Apophysomyces sp. BC1034]|nr:hypothetical protein DFQ28_009771 [Apophysomyces sp. BC1034]